jgi:hypothetical protein
MGWHLGQTQNRQPILMGIDQPPPRGPLVLGPPAIATAERMANKARVICAKIRFERMSSSLHCEDQEG